MQDNVNRLRTLAAVLVSFAVFSVLICAYTLAVYEPKEAFSVDEREPDAVAFPSVNDGIKYLGNGFAVTEYTESVAKGQNARIEVTSSVTTDINISVYYASGKSTSSSFTEKTVPAGETVAWEWTVPENTSTDKIRIVLRSGDSYATFKIDVL